MEPTGQWTAKKGDTPVKGTCALYGLPDPPQSNCSSVWWPVLMVVTGGLDLNSQQEVLSQSTSSWKPGVA